MKVTGLTLADWRQALAQLNVRHGSAQHSFLECVVGGGGRCLSELSGTFGSRKEAAAILLHCCDLWRIKHTEQRNGRSLDREKSDIILREWRKIWDIQVGRFLIPR